MLNFLMRRALSSVPGKWIPVHPRCSVLFCSVVGLVNWNLWRFQLLSRLKCKTLCLSATLTHWSKVLCESQEVSLLWPPSRNVNSSVDVKGTLCWKLSTWQNTECDQVVISSKGPLWLIFHNHRGLYSSHLLCGKLTMLVMKTLRSLFH